MLNEMMKKSENRISWIDNMKAFGILAIFCGHMGAQIGRLLGFVFSFHVPLFFFVSGLFASKCEQLGFVDVVKKKIKQILLPYFFLVVINMAVLVVVHTTDLTTYMKYMKEFICGIRNQVPAPSMWFFSCLFCAEIIFEILRRIWKSKWLVFVVACVICAIQYVFLPNEPSFFFNIDSAMYYLVYYTLGYLMSDFLLKNHFKQGKRYKHVCFMAFITVLFFYILNIYIGNDFLTKIIYIVPGGRFGYQVFRPMIIILGIIVVAKICQDSEIIGYVGTQTLWLCGNEYIAKEIMNAMASILGLSIKIESALAAIVYSCILIIFILGVLAPIEKKMFNRCISFWT